MPVTGATTRARADTRAGRSVARNSALGMAAQVAIRMLSVLFGIAVIRRFGSDTFGRYTAALAFVSLFSVLSDLGLGAWGVRAVAQNRDRTNALVAQVACMRLALSAATALLIVGSAAFLYPPRQVLAIAVATGTLFLFSVNGALDMAWLGRERLDVSSSVSVINQLAFVTIGTFVLVMHGGVIALLLASLGALALATAVSWQLARRWLALGVARPVVREWWPLVRGCAPIGAVQISLLISYKVDAVLLSIFRDSAAVGIYAVAYNLIFSLMLFSHSVNLALFPALARVADDRRALAQLVERAMKYLLVVAVPIAFGGALLAPPLIRALYTDAYARSAVVLQIVIWVLPLMFLTEFLGYFATAIHRERKMGRAALVMAGANIALNLVCIPRFGIWAAAIITVVTEVIFLAQYLWFLRDRGAPGALGALAWRPVLASIAMCAAVAVAGRSSLPLAIAAGAAVYGGALVLLSGVTPADIAALRRPRAGAPVVATALVADGLGSDD